MMLLSILAGAGILGNKDRCLTSLFVPHFKNFLWLFVVKRHVYFLSLSLSLSLSPPLPPLFLWCELLRNMPVLTYAFT